MHSCGNGFDILLCTKYIEEINAPFVLKCKKQNRCIYRFSARLSESLYSVATKELCRKFGYISVHIVVVFLHRRLAPWRPSISATSISKKIVIFCSPSGMTPSGFWCRFVCFPSVLQFGTANRMRHTECHEEIDRRRHCFYKMHKYWISMKWLVVRAWCVRINWILSIPLLHFVRVDEAHSCTCTMLAENGIFVFIVGVMEIHVFPSPAPVKSKTSCQVGLRSARGKFISHSNAYCNLFRIARGFATQTQTTIHQLTGWQLQSVRWQQWWLPHAAVSAMSLPKCENTAFQY